MTTDFEMVQGDTRYIRYDCYNDDGTALDLSTANNITWGCIRFGDFNSNTVITKTIGSGISIEGVNTVVVKIEGSDTSDINGKFEHTLKLEDFTNDIFSKNGLFVINISSI